MALSRFPARTKQFTLTAAELLEVLMDNIRVLITHMANVWVLITIGVGFFFYGLRCRLRLCYGVLELMVAFIIIYLTFHPLRINLADLEPPLWDWLLSKSVGFLAGVYVMIRALDNIEKGLPPHLRASWHRVFYRKVLDSLRAQAPAAAPRSPRYTGAQSPHSGTSWLSLSRKQPRDQF